MATKTRKPQTDTLMAEEILREEVTLEQAQAEERGAATLLAVTEKGAAVAAKTGNTLQRPDPDAKYGRDWRVPGTTRPNTRAAALDELKLQGSFTFEEGMAVLKGLPLGSGTPRSYLKAFIASGYVA